MSVDAVRLGGRRRRGVPASWIVVGAAVTGAAFLVGAVWLAVASTGGAGASGVALPAKRLPEVPAFGLPSLYGGRPAVSLASVTGRPVVLSFFASWCTGCQQELRTMATVAHDAPPGVAVIGVDVNDQGSAARALLASDHLTYQVGADQHGDLSAAVGLVGLPTTLFLAPDHHTVGEVVGPLTPALAAGWLHELGRMHERSSA